MTGELGASAATIALLTAGKKLRPEDFPSHFFPRPRVEVGRFLRKAGLASAMIDISDGLSTDLGHICDESGVGAEIERAAIPVATVGKPVRPVDLRFALHGGEDYELLFTAPPKKRVPSRIAGVAVRPIGLITGGRKSGFGIATVRSRGWRRRVGNTSRNNQRARTWLRHRLCGIGSPTRSGRAQLG